METLICAAYLIDCAKVNRSCILNGCFGTVLRLQRAVKDQPHTSSTRCQLLILPAYRSESSSREYRGKNFLLFFIESPPFQKRIFINGNLHLTWEAFSAAAHEGIADPIRTHAVCAVLPANDNASRVHHIVAPRIFQSSLMAGPADRFFGGRTDFVHAEDEVHPVMTIEGCGDPVSHTRRCSSSCRQRRHRLQK